MLAQLGITREELSVRAGQFRQYFESLSATDRVAALTAQAGLSAASLVNRASSPSPSAASRFKFPSPLTSVSSSARLGQDSTGASASSSSQDASEDGETDPAVKTEPVDSVPLGRHMDTMEAIIEAQRLAKEMKKVKKEAIDVSRRVVIVPDSELTPTQDDRVTSLMTPQQSKYYREHTMKQTMVSSRLSLARSSLIVGRV
jgi:hypothetical protein